MTPAPVQQPPIRSLGQDRRLTKPGKRKRIARLLRTIALVVVVLVAIGPVNALRSPSADPTSAKLAEWARDHQLGFVVTGAESALYRLHPPKVGGAPDTSIINALPQQAATQSNSASGRSPAHSSFFPTRLRPLASGVVSGEGIFHTVTSHNGDPTSAIAYLRPDNQHSSYLAGVVWLNHTHTALVQHPGHEDPGNVSSWSNRDFVSAAPGSNLIATFNGGFKIKDAKGGYYQDGKTAGTLQPGAASLVVYRDGHADVGSWDKDVRMSPAVVSVRQSLKPLIENGQVTSDLTKNVESKWGATLGGAYFVWRSGIGITKRGDLVYVAGDALSVKSLATLLLHAGAVRGMQLDINKAWISYMYFADGGGSLQPHKLVPFERPVNRYLTPTSRDFFAVYSK